MRAISRCLLLVALLAVTVASSGCCCMCGGGCGSCGGCGGCCHPFARRSVPDGYMGGGSYWEDCGCSCEVYCGDWHSVPACPDPCDCYGNYTGCHDDYAPGYQLPPRHSSSYGSRMIDASGPASSPTPAAKPMNRSGAAPGSVMPMPVTPPSEDLPRAGERTSYEQPAGQPKKHCATCGY